MTLNQNQFQSFLDQIQLAIQSNTLCDSTPFLAVRDVNFASLFCNKNPLLKTTLSHSLSRFIDYISFLVSFKHEYDYYLFFRPLLQKLLQVKHDFLISNWRFHTFEGGPIPDSCENDIVLKRIFNTLFQKDLYTDFLKQFLLTSYPSLTLLDDEITTMLFSFVTDVEFYSDLWMKSNNEFFLKLIFEFVFQTSPLSSIQWLFYNQQQILLLFIPKFTFVNLMNMFKSEMDSKVITFVFERLNKNQIDAFVKRLSTNDHFSCLIPHRSLVNRIIDGCLENDKFYYKHIQTLIFKCPILGESDSISTWVQHFVKHKTYWNFLNLLASHRLSIRTWSDSNENKILTHIMEFQTGHSKSKSDSYIDSWISVFSFEYHTNQQNFIVQICQHHHLFSLIETIYIFFQNNQSYDIVNNFMKNKTNSLNIL